MENDDSDRRRPQDCPHNRIPIQRHRVRRSNRWTNYSVVLGEDRSKTVLPFLAYPFQHFLEFVMKELKHLDDEFHLQDCQKLGMKINGAKCKTLSTSDQRINIDGQEIEHVEEFLFLGSVLPDSSTYIKRRIALAAAAFGQLKEAILSGKSGPLVSP